MYDGTLSRANKSKKTCIIYLTSTLYVVLYLYGEIHYEL